MKRREVLVLLAAAAAAARVGAYQQVVTATGNGAALPAEVGASLPGARLIGSGRLRVWGLHVYDARLWAADDFKPTDFADTPLALEVEYARALEGAQIAERSLDEMKRSGAIAADKATHWLAEMKRLFPDVAAGDRITGVQLQGGTARFFVNGRLRGDVRDAEFARRFFGIWLAPETSEPKLRAALLGTRRSAS